MARRYIGFSPNKGAAAFRNVYKDETGRPLVLLEEDEVARLELDFTSYVESGENITLGALSNNNITATIAFVSSAQTGLVLTISGAKTWGETTVTVTFSTGDIYAERIRVRNRVRHIISRKTTDYGEAHP